MYTVIQHSLFLKDDAAMLCSSLDQEAQAVIQAPSSSMKLTSFFK
jgi:hypothetical protein